MSSVLGLIPPSELIIYLILAGANICVFEHKKETNSEFRKWPHNKFKKFKKFEKFRKFRVPRSRYAYVYLQVLTEI